MHRYIFILPKFCLPGTSTSPKTIRPKHEVSFFGHGGSGQHGILAPEKFCKRVRIIYEYL